MDGAGKKILKTFSNIKAKDIEFIDELPQESVSLKRSDYIMKVTDFKGSAFLVIWEFLSKWSTKPILNLIDYYVRSQIKYDLPVRPVVFLLQDSTDAKKYYKDRHLKFNFNLVKVYDFNAPEFVKKQDVELLPFVPLMKEATEAIVFEAEERIYNESRLTTEEKANLLTAMAIFAGLKDKNLTLKLVQRRRDIMIESYAYEIIMEEGKKEGKKEGRKEGKLTTIRENIITTLNIRFNSAPDEVIQFIGKIKDMNLLNNIFKFAITTERLEDFQRLLHAENRDERFYD